MYGRLDYYSGTSEERLLPIGSFRHSGLSGRLSNTASGQIAHSWTPLPLSGRSWQEPALQRILHFGQCAAGSFVSPGMIVGGSVLPGGGSSIVEITRFQFQQFTVSIKELAEWFGSEGCADRGG